jgi:PIN domain nuclease of toxin-antitoxin system
MGGHVNQVAEDAARTALLPVTAEVLATSHRLPQRTKDPFDQLLIAGVR